MSSTDSRTVDQCRVTLIDSMGHDLRVVDSARVSMNKTSQWDRYDDNDVLSPKDAGLISYLASHDHWTPFAHVVVTLRIACPMFVARQWFKHTVGGVRNEVSRRYVDEEPEYFLPDMLRCRPGGSIKQGSGGNHPHSYSWKQRIRRFYEAADELYMDMISDQVAPEQARIVLPMAHMTEFYETASLSFYARAAGLRLDAHAQLEIREMMQLIEGVVQPVAPVSWAKLVQDKLEK